MSEEKKSPSRAFEVITQNKQRTGRNERIDSRKQITYTHVDIYSVEF